MSLAAYCSSIYFSYSSFYDSTTSFGGLFSSPVIDLQICYTNTAIQSCHSIPTTNRPAKDLACIALECWLKSLLSCKQTICMKLIKYCLCSFPLRPNSVKIYVLLLFSVFPVLHECWESWYLCVFSPFLTPLSIYKIMYFSSKENCLSIFFPTPSLPTKAL
jgi:hypothetical protein